MVDCDVRWFRWIGAPYPYSAFAAALLGPSGSTNSSTELGDGQRGRSLA